MDSHTFELRVASVADPSGMQQMQGETSKLTGETAKLTQELADLEAGERSLKTTFGGATKERMEALRAELALRKEITTETKAATEAQVELKKAVDEPSLTHEDKSFKSAVRDIRQNRRAEGAVEGFMHMAPEQFATMGVVRGIESITEAAGPAIAGIAGMGLAFETAKKTMEMWGEEVPHFKDELEALAAGMSEGFKDILKGMFGDGDWALKKIQDITEWLGFETAATKKLHGAVEDYVGIARHADTATDAWAKKLKELTEKAGEAKTAVADMAAEQKELNELNSDESARDLAAELEEINNNEALSAEEKSVRIIQAQKRSDDAKAAARAQARADALEDAETEQTNNHNDAQAKLDAFNAQQARILAHDAYALQRDEVEKKRVAAARAERHLENNPDPGAQGDSSLFAGGETNEDYIKRSKAWTSAKVDSDAAKAALKEANDKLASLGKAVPGLKKFDAEKEEKVRDEMDESAAEAIKKETANQEHLDSLRRKDDVARLREKRDQDERDRVTQLKLDQATGTGNSPGALGPDGFNRPGIDEQAQIDAQKKWEEGQQKGSGHGKSEGSDHGSGGGGVVVDGPSLREIASNTRGGGSGGGGSSNGGSSSGGSSGGSGAPHGNAGVREKLEKFAEDRLAYDLAEAQKIDKTLDPVGRQDALNKAQKEHYDRVAGLDAAMAAHEQETGGKPGHTNSAVTGHGQSPHAMGRAMGEAAGEIIAVKVHAAITEGDKAKMALVAQQDHDAAVAGHPRVIGLQSEDPNDLTGKGKFAAGGRGGVGGYSMGSPHGETPPPAPGDPDPFLHQPQVHSQVPAGAQQVGLPDTSGFGAIHGMVAHMGAMVAHVGELVGHSRQAAKAFETSTHKDQFVSRIDDPYAQ